MIALASRVLMIGLAVYSYFQIRANLPENLPGTPAGTAAKLLFGIQLAVILIFFIVPFFPESIHFGSRRLSDYAPQRLEQIMPMVKDMLGLMGLLMTLYFAVNVHLLLVQAHSREPRLTARSIAATQPWLIGALVVGEAGVTLYYLRRFDSLTSSGTPDGPSSSDSDPFR